MNVAAVDIVFSILVLIGAFRAAVRGFVKELMSMAALILGIGLAVLFSGLVGSYLVTYLGDSPWNQVIAFLGIFLGVYLLTKIFESALNRLVEHISLENLDHALGFFLGIVEGLALVFVLVLVMQIQPFFDMQAVLEESFYAYVLLPLLPYASELIQTGAGDV